MTATQRCGLDPRKVIAALGIDVLLSEKLHHSGLVVGEPPSPWARIERDATGAPFVCVCGDDAIAWAYALHEALHLALGSGTFEDEAGMMAIEWTVAQELADPWWSAWRENFACFGLPRGMEDGIYLDEVGASDRFLASSAWRDCQARAVAMGWLVDIDGALACVWGLGAHESLAERGADG